MVISLMATEWLVCEAFLKALKAFQILEEYTTATYEAKMKHKVSHITGTITYRCYVIEGV